VLEYAVPSSVGTGFGVGAGVGVGVGFGVGVGEGVVEKLGSTKTASNGIVSPSGVPPIVPVNTKNVIKALRSFD